MKQRLFSMFTGLVSKILSYANEATRRSFAASIAPDTTPVIEVDSQYGPIRFLCPEKTAAWRAKTLFTKEPDTLKWIDRMDTEDVLWDIGANVGSYSIYAGLRGLRVAAFEPAFTNYYLLNKNLFSNGLDGKVSAYCIALADTKNMGHLYMPSLELGAALHQFGQDETGAEAAGLDEIGFRQGMIGIPIDELVQDEDMPFPNHIKIDVDGIDDLILKGAATTLADPRVKSVLIEVAENETDKTNAIKNTLEQAGLSFIGKFQSEMFAGGPWEHVFNYLFARS